MSYLVTYDLCKPGRNYDGLIEEIESFNHTKVAESAWVVTSTLTASQIFDKLRPHIDSNDILFVVALRGEATWRGLPKSASDWLHDNLNR